MTRPTTEAAVQTHVDTTDWTLLMIVNDAEGFGEAVHDMAEGAFRIQQTHRKTLLFEPGALPHPDFPPTAADRQAGRYVVLARNSRRAVRRGPIADLLKGAAPDRGPSIRSVRRAFAAGDRR